MTFKFSKYTNANNLFLKYIEWDATQEPSTEFNLLTREDGTDTVSRNVGKQLPHNAAYYPKRAAISTIFLTDLMYLSFCYGQNMFI
jgi:hypothetical protein